jgi:hypothetical protein
MENAASTSGISTPPTRTQNIWYIWNLFTEHSYAKDGESVVTVTEFLKLLNRGIVFTDRVRCLVCLITRDLPVQNLTVPTIQIFSDGRFATCSAAPTSM